MTALVDELKRRRVLNVAGVYLVVMWLIIQVADITFTRLGLPEWTVTFVIVLGALMFPVLVALAWAFDLTRAGIALTAPPSDDGHDTDQPPPGRPHFRLTLIVAALMTVPLLGFGIWWTGFRGARGADLDRDLLVVTPFRLAGASDDLGYLREGLMDLIAARVGGAGSELRVVAPRSISREIKETLGSLDADPDRDEARRIAAGFGAGLLLEGDVVGTGDRFTVAARLYDVRTGYSLDAAELPAHPDSLHDLIDRIAARLVAAESGLREDRLAALTTASMPALLAFLDAEQAFRRGDHDRAIRGYDRAVTLDSTFALAALGLLRARGWTIGLESENAARAEAIVRRGLDRLSESDRLFFEAMLGDEGPERYRDVIDNRISAARRMPHLVELQYLAGDGVMHYGVAVGMPDAWTVARRYFERTVAMDSTYLEPLTHLHDLAYIRADTAEMRHYGNLVLAVDSTSPVATAVRYARQKVGQSPDQATLSLDTLEFTHLLNAGTTGWFFRPDEGLIDELARRLEDLDIQHDRVRAAGALKFLAMMTGRPSHVERANQALAEAGEEDDVGELSRAIYWTRDLEAAREAGRAVARRLMEERRAIDPDSPLPSSITERECVLGHLQATDGETDRALDHAAALESAIEPRRDARSNAYDRTCADFLRTAVAVRTGGADAADRMEALHRDLSAGARRPPTLAAAYDLASIDLWEQLGRPERALEVSRRRVHLPTYGIWHTVLDGENARLADQLGLRDEAIRSYARYLDWLDRAEGVFADRADRARADLERLVSEQ